MRKPSSRFVIGIIIFAAAIVALHCTALQSRPTHQSVTLSMALADVTEIRVRTGGMCHRTPEAEYRVFTLRGDECRDLISHIHVTDMGGTCQCCGDYTFEFYRGSKRVASISLHHWKHLRWDNGRWDGDAALSEESIRYLKQLMQSHGVNVPMETQKPKSRKLRICSSDHRHAELDSASTTTLDAESSSA